MSQQAPGGRRITSQRERAGFEPIPPNVDIPALIEQTPNFKELRRLDAREITPEHQESIDRDVYETVIVKGLPLVIENWHLRRDWPRWIFNTEWLRENHGRDHINVRDLKDQADIQMTFAHYIDNLSRLASKFKPENYDGNQQRLYGKDLDCPDAWRKTLSKLLPSSTFYLSPSADLMSSLPPGARAENMMCYVGHEGTFTPAHREMCGSLGQNIMVHTSPEAENEEAGSSIWFMMSSADRDSAAEYWLSRMGHDIEVESHFAGLHDLGQAPFTVFVHEQKLGDYILVPPLAPHQVWNRGRATVKAAWNRTTVDTLELALSEALPKARLVCRDEQYKNRAIIYDTLKLYAEALGTGICPPGISEMRLKRDFIRLFKLFDRILLDECFSPDAPTPTGGVELIPNEYNVQCSFCRGNIFNRFLSCKSCIGVADDGDEDCYDVCMDCYARGRSCGCISDLSWVEQYRWQTLEDHHEVFRQIVLTIQGFITNDSPQDLEHGLQRLGRKTLARVCQDQMAVRPWADINKNGLEEEEDGETPKDRGLNCHVCKVRHKRWKCAECTTCAKAYCYGNLWRAFDMDPFDDVLSKFDWKCPVCLGICSCGACRKKPDARPYEPKGTFLGASTKHVADPRSIESLVDFARGNLGWVRDSSGALKRKRDSIATTGGSPVSFTKTLNDTDFSVSPDIPIDPALDGISNDAGEGRFNYPCDEQASNALGSLQALSTAQAQAAGRLSTGGNVLGMAEGSAAEENGGDGAGSVPTTEPLLLPSPSAMLTGALPRSEYNITTMTLDHITTPGSGTSTYNNEAIYPSTSAAALSFTNSSDLSALLNGRFFDDQHQGSDFSMPTNLSALEQDPMAFIAAAGLLQLPNAGLSSGPSTPPLMDLGMLSPFTTTAAAAAAAVSTATIHPELLLQRNPTPPPPPPPPSPPPPAFTIPRRPPRQRSTTTQSPLPPPIQEREWVRKTKAASQRVANLRGRRRDSRIVVLRGLPSSRFGPIAAAADVVTSDLRRLPGGRVVSVRQPTNGTPGTARMAAVRKPTPELPASRPRGRPRKVREEDIVPVPAARDMGDSDNTTAEGDGEGEGGEGDGEAAGVDPSKEDRRASAKRRRESTWATRKQQEDAAREEYARTLAARRPSDASIAYSVTAAGDENRPPRRAGKGRGGRWGHVGDREVAAVLRVSPEEETAAEAAAREAQAAADAAEAAAADAVVRAARREERDRLRRKEADRRAKLVAAGLMDSEEADIDPCPSSSSPEPRDPEPDSEPEPAPQSPTSPPPLSPAPEEPAIPTTLPEVETEANVPVEDGDKPPAASENPAGQKPDPGFAVVVHALPPGFDRSAYPTFAEDTPTATATTGAAPQSPTSTTTGSLISAAPGTTGTQKRARTRARPRKKPSTADDHDSDADHKEHVGRKRAREDSSPRSPARRRSKRVTVKTIQLKPGRWAKVEISEDSSEASPTAERDKGDGAGGDFFEKGDGDRNMEMEVDGDGGRDGEAEGEAEADGEEGEAEKGGKRDSTDVQDAEMPVEVDAPEGGYEKRWGRRRW